MMVSMKLTVLLGVAVLASFASSAVVTPNYNGTTINDDKNQALLDVTDDNDYSTELYGKLYTLLSDEEQKDLADEEDKQIIVGLDLLVGTHILQGRRDGADSVVSGVNNSRTEGGRQKRWIPLVARGIFTAGRALFKGAARAPKPTFSGSRITQSYTRNGNYNDALRDFNRFKPKGVKSFSNNGISGRTGTVGNHRFTVRDGSKQGSPTLEIRSPRTNGEYVRKFRYDKK